MGRRGAPARATSARCSAGPSTTRHTPHRAGVRVAAHGPVLEEEGEFAVPAGVAASSAGRSPPPWPTLARPSLAGPRARFAIVAGDEVARSGAADALAARGRAPGLPVLRHRAALQRRVPHGSPAVGRPLPPTRAAMRDALSPGSTLVLLIGSPRVHDVRVQRGLPAPPELRLIHLSPSHADVGRIYPVALGLVGDPAATLTACSRSSPRSRTPLDGSPRPVAGRPSGGRPRTPPIPHPSDRGDGCRPARLRSGPFLQALPSEATVVEEAPTSDQVVRQHHRVSTPTGSSTRGEGRSAGGWAPRSGYRSLGAATG